MDQIINTPEHVLVWLDDTINTYDRIGIVVSQEDADVFRKILRNAEYIIYDKYSSTKKFRSTNDVRISTEAAEPFVKALQMRMILGEDVDMDSLIRTLRDEYNQKMREKILKEFPNAEQFFKN